MAEVIRTWSLRNGLKLEVVDLSQNYYGGYWNVKLVVKGRVRVEPPYLDGLMADPLAEEARRELGQEVEYRRELTRIGVAEEELEQAKGELLSYFEENALRYMQHEAFPQRFVRRRFEEVLKELRIRRLQEQMAKEADDGVAPQDLQGVRHKGRRGGGSDPGDR